MTAIYHVNGTASLYVNGGLLGVSSADGVSISLETGIVPINSDERGPFIPSENLINGTLALIEFELWKYDQSVLAAIMAKREGGNAGSLPAIGKLMFYNELTFPFQIASPIDGLPWSFPQCWVSTQPQSVQLSTQLKIWKMQIAACPNSSGTLYTNS